MVNSSIILGFGVDTTAAGKTSEHVSSALQIDFLGACFFLNIIPQIEY